MSKPRERWIYTNSMGRPIVSETPIDAPNLPKASEIHVIEYSAYKDLEQELMKRIARITAYEKSTNELLDKCDRCREALERIATDTLREFEWVKIARQALKADEGE